MLIDVAEGDMNVQAPGLLRAKSGKLLMNCLRAHKSGGSSTMCFFSSSDDGKTWNNIGRIADDLKAEYANLDCFFTKDHAILTYMYAKPAWNRKQIHLKATIIPMAWFGKKESSNKTDAGDGK